MRQLTWQTPLGKIKFKYKIGNEELGINEVVILVDVLNKNLHYKERFVIYVVDSVRISNEKIYINSYETEGKIITTSFNYPSKRNQTGINKDDMIIAFGKISYYEPKDQYYLNILSDLNIVKINDEELIERFNNKKMSRREITKKDSVIEKKENNSINIDLVKSPSSKDIASKQKAIKQEQQVKPREIKEIMKKDISDSSEYVYEPTFIEEVENKKGFFSKVFRKLSTILRKDNWVTLVKGYSSSEQTKLYRRWKSKVNKRQIEIGKGIKVMKKEEWNDI